jgi:hypothetical protein
MRSKQALIAIIVAAIILFGASGAYLYSQKSPEKPEQTAATAEENNAEKSSVAGTLKEIINSGQTQQCNFSHENTEGVAYISGSKMRTDMNITDENGKKSTIYVIRNGDENYIWGSEFPNNTGLKMTMSIDELAENDAANQYLDMDKKVDYKCSAWSENSAILTPPQNITFNDLSGFIQNAISDKLKASEN